MGIADRDYMRERYRERVKTTPSGYTTRVRPRPTRQIILILIGSAIAAAIVVSLMLRHPSTSNGMGPMQVTTVSEEGVVPQETVVVQTAMPAQTFPASGTIEWGAQGEPIGGGLERLEIWDVTASPQNKMIIVRSGPATTYATVYLQPGQRVTLMVLANRAYQVMATSGDAWQGRDERFGSNATTVDFGMVNIHPGRPGVIAMGASDQLANIVPNDRF